MSDTAPVFELRRYRLQPEKRERLLDLFEREFVEPQEQAGMTLHGLYRDRNDPDAFVWMRSFPDMARRKNALSAFYGGEVWRRWGSEANDTMLNSDNVLLLKAAGNSLPFAGTYGTGGLVAVSVCSLAPGREEDVAAEWERSCRPVLESCGARIDAAFVTERSVNSFPRLPVREGESVFVWISAFPDEARYMQHTDRLARSPAWTGSAFAWLDAQLWRPLETASLSPTRRSRHGW
ncbi:NIPSNAP family protein [Nitratireductor sp. ZSWI3]|uniref:NIPSNAP family protein n=1 Tax=Nitratireductor sp. ZSWI3 TaxID=2966359 RepID=UPI00215060BA|nr:NIPSNAP family protein [Nitratireductor sp. ZSWI3]MCR4268004.1 NIPSNAP family protein [Nitratireductor sp. ZSWI3]